jgi:ketosteroid isomerase-like protein
MIPTKILALSLALAASLPAFAAPTPQELKALQAEVFATERAFARTMADRDLAAFGRFLAEDTVWFSGPQPLHGRQAVIDQWKRFYDKPQAPFSWEPDTVEVLDSGTLAHSSGPVRDAGGNVVGRFNTVWRHDGPHAWHVVFDKGEDVCEAAPKKP